MTTSPLVEVLALKSVRYNGILRVPGTESERFSARPSDAKVLKALRKVSYASDEAAVRILASNTTVPVTRPMIPQAPKDVGGGELGGDEYARRDVTTENVVTRDTVTAGGAKDGTAEKEKEEAAKSGKSKYVKEDVKKELEKDKAEGRKSKGE